MKNIFAIFLIFLMFSSCTKLEDLNKNIKDPTAVPGESLFTGAQKYLADQMVTPNVNRNIFELISQYWTETTYTDEVNYDITTRPIPGNHWNQLYVNVLKGLDESAKVIQATGTLPGDGPSVVTNKLAIIEVLTVYTYSVLVETFGDVPYSEALVASVLLPKYDDGLTVYKDLISRLNAAIGKMDQGAGSFGSTDNMYGGDVTKWYKFANSLKLRMGMLLSDVDNALASTTVGEAAPNVILSNADNASLDYLGAQPNTNPIYDNLIASGRDDFVPANTLVDMMNGLNDPRRPLYYTEIDTGGGNFAYVGGIYGASNNFANFSHVSAQILTPTFETLFFDAAETEFLLAEGVERGFSVGGTAEEHYNNAIRASIAYWGGTDADATTYLAQSNVAYSSENSWQQKIGEQKWIALYLRGFDAWTSFRMLDYPKLVAPPTTEEPFPIRLTYPTIEQTLNGVNRAAAAAAIGGDATDYKTFLGQTLTVIHLKKEAVSNFETASFFNSSHFHPFLKKLKFTFPYFRCWSKPGCCEKS